MSSVPCLFVRHLCGNSKESCLAHCSQWVGWWQPERIRFFSESGFAVSRWIFEDPFKELPPFSMEVCGWTVGVTYYNYTIFFELYTKDPSTPLPKDMAAQLQSAFLTWLVAAYPDKMAALKPEETFCMRCTEVSPPVNVSEFLNKCADAGIEASVADMSL